MPSLVWTVAMFGLIRTVSIPSSLGAGVVEFAGFAYLEGAGPEEENFVYIVVYHCVVYGWLISLGGVPGWFRLGGSIWVGRLGGV